MGYLGLDGNRMTEKLLICRMKYAKDVGVVNTFIVIIVSLALFEIFIVIVFIACVRDEQNSNFELTTLLLVYKTLRDTVYK